jgi:hypothetical protein
VYHLLIAGQGWGKTKDTLPSSRVFEYTDDGIAAVLRPSGKFDIAKISSIPAIFTSEISGNDTARAYVGTIRKVQASGKEVTIDYHLDENVSTLTNRDLKEMSSDLGIEDFEFHRTHWAVKDVDLYKVLFDIQLKNKPRPKVLRVGDDWTVDPNLASVMMPFDPTFNDVFRAIKRTAKKIAGLNCLRADDIWDDPAVIQDVFSLIYRSILVICDCTGRNSNVFYEAGIAHTLGREVILITQSKEDVPFDLRHLRFVQYVNDSKGRAALSKKLERKIQDVLGV